jgi:release factor glutamine methyltransferase
VRPVGEVVRLSTDYLGRQGSPTPRLDAELLIAHALGVSRIDLYTGHDRLLDEGELAAVRGLLERRGRHEPVAYLLGSWGFRGLDLAVDERVLVPRPETEELVGVCLELLGVQAAPCVLDVGTGSGAIALAVKHERPVANVTAVDISDGALDVARGNAERLRLEVEFLRSDLLDGLSGRRFDLIASNPPYIADAAVESLQPEVRDFEPRLATVSGPDGGELLARLVDDAPGNLERPGWLVVECADGQAPSVQARMRERGYADVQVHADFAGIDRTVAGCLR